MQHDELANQAGTFASAAKSSVYEILTASGISILALTASAIGLASGSGLLLPALCAAFAAMTIATGYLAARLARDLTYDLPGTDPAPAVTRATTARNNSKQSHV